MLNNTAIFRTILIPGLMLGLVIGGIAAEEDTMDLDDAVTVVENPVSFVNETDYERYDSLEAGERFSHAVHEHNAGALAVAGDGGSTDTIAESTVVSSISTLFAPAYLTVGWGYAFPDRIEEMLVALLVVAAADLAVTLFRIYKAVR